MTFSKKITSTFLSGKLSATIAIPIVIARNDLFRIYTKRRKNKKVIVRAERQEYPNEGVMLALVKKLYPNGQLINS
jgi:hypothetical protein